MSSTVWNENWMLTAREWLAWESIFRTLERIGVGE
jgi:hypothetical protein